MSATSQRSHSGLRVAAFIVTYKREKTLANTIVQYGNQTLRPAYVVVVDNDPACSARDAATAAGAVYVPMGDNVGPAGGVCAGLKEAAQLDCDAVVWGDDDDPPKTEREFEQLAASLSSAPPDVAAVGLLGAHFRRGRFVALRSVSMAHDTDVDYVPGGGLMMMRRDVAAGLAAPDTDLFFSFEDLSVALELMHRGLRVRICAAAYNERYRLSGKSQIVRQHRVVPFESAGTLWRRFYSVRNYLYLMRKYGRTEYAILETLKVCARCAAATRRGSRFSLEYAALMGQAVRDGWQGRLGRTIEPVRKQGVE
jgi:GT2 family glycosyltransferase